MKNNHGCLVISLDFELLWGVFDLVEHQEKISYFHNTRKAIPAILEEFDQKDIHATWATVGMLFNENWKEWERNFPNEVPKYYKRELSAYEFGKRICTNETEKLVFAPDLIKEILKIKGQEIGSHTYSHYYCLEEGQDPEAFKEDLLKAIEVAEKIGISLKSLVFPRNQIKEEYLKICGELGIQNVRSNPSAWYWENVQSEMFLTKLARSGDAYLPFGNKTYAIEEMKRRKGFPLEQKSSRFLRPVEGNKYLRKMKLNRIKKELTFAAKNGHVYHLWWHPHNFGDLPEESLKDLREILNHFINCRKKFGMKSLNMLEVGEVNLSQVKIESKQNINNFL